MDRSVSFDMFDVRPDVTKEIFKTKRSGIGTRREYKRMLEERQLGNVAEHSTPIVNDDSKDSVKSMFAIEDTIKVQSAKPDVTSFPFSETSVDSKTKSAEKALPSEEHSGQHGARLCMISAMVHMKVLASKRAKTIRELRKKPLTSMDEKRRNSQDDDDSDDVEPRELVDDDEFAELKKCRYLRGRREKELTIEEIFR